jgi:hypothetical protein
MLNIYNFAHLLERMEGDKKSSRISGRIPSALRDRLNRIVQDYGTSDSAILENILPAFCDAVEEAAAVRLPVVVLLAEKQLMVAEHGPGKGGATTSEKPPNKSQRYRGDGPRRAVS